MSRSCVVCFDLDDTLVSECDYVESGLRCAGALLDAEASAGASAAERLVAWWRDDRGRDGFQRLLRERGLPEASWLPRLKRAYRDHVPTMCLRPGAVELLDALTRRGCALCIVTDGYLDVQRRKWAALNPPFRFDPVIFTDERGPDYWKPNPWAFQQVMRAHPRAADYRYVADNPAKDFVAPNRLGWKTVMVRNEQNLHSSSFDEGTSSAPSLVVDSLTALADMW